MDFEREKLERTGQIEKLRGLDREIRSRIRDVWLFPSERRGPAGFRGVGPAFFIGDQPSSATDWPECNSGRRLLYGKLHKYGLADAHLTDFYKAPGRAAQLQHFRQEGLPGDWATLHKPFLLRELDLVQPERIVCMGDRAFQLMREYLPDYSDMLFPMMHFAYGVRPGNALRFEAELVASAGLAAEAAELSVETLRAQGPSDSFSVRRTYLLVKRSQESGLNGQQLALYKMLCEACERRGRSSLSERALQDVIRSPESGLRTRHDFGPEGKETTSYDLAYGRSDIETFPFAMWRRILLRHARKAAVREFDYGPAVGSLALRRAICAHLRRSRAVVCDPSEVIIVNGSQQALDLVARVLIERGDRVAIEDPHYNGTREVLRAAGARLQPVPVDRDGLNPAQLPEHASLVFVTPSHQFPTGAILPLGRRLALLEWARRKNSVIVEDDYDGEFHYEGRPLESLQGLDTEGRIVYIRTFSRTVFPALRIGYLIVPKSLAPAFTAAKWLNDLHSATLEQQTLAEFITSGMYERHLRRLRRRNSARREALLHAIREDLGERVEVTGDGSGAHVVLWPKERVPEDAVIAHAASRGVGIYGISHCFLRRPSRTAFMLGYSCMNEREIREGIRLLAEVF